MRLGDAQRDANPRAEQKKSPRPVKAGGLERGWLFPQLIHDPVLRFFQSHFDFRQIVQPKRIGIFEMVLLVLKGS